MSPQGSGSQGKGPPVQLRARREPPGSSPQASSPKRREQEGACKRTDLGFSVPGGPCSSHSYMCMRKNAHLQKKWQDNPQRREVATSCVNKPKARFLLAPQSEKIHSFAARMRALSSMMENEKGKIKKKKNTHKIRALLELERAIRVYSLKLAQFPTSPHTRR